METTAPNLFIIGAPKCGTTSLFHWFAEHPDICGAAEKETYYLLDPDYPMRREGQATFHEHGLDGYSRFFRDCCHEHYRMEATPDYLYQKTALEFISALQEKQIIVVLRKPSERIYSLYQFARNNAGTLDMDVSFAEFIRNIREQGPLLENKPILRMAIQHSRYIDYIESWLSVVDRDSMHILLFEELVRTPLDCMRQLSTALNIDASVFDDFDFVAHNQTEAVRSKALHRLRCSVHAFLGRHGGTYIPERIKHAMHSAYSRLNQSPGQIERAAQDRLVMAELDACFLSCNDRLQALTGVDLAAWER